MSFGGPDKALVLLVTETAVQVHLWQKKTLRALQTLGNTPDDQRAFVDLLGNYPEVPTLIVTDLIDENFRHDTIVHVGGSDRAALLKRKLDFAFRNTRYRIGIVTGRMTEGRKDDKVMLCALTKPERIDIWARLLLEAKMPVIGITSIAHVLSSYLPVAKLDNEKFLIVTKLDHNNNLRQTFVNEGRIIFSRLASLGEVDPDRLSMEILQESTQLRQYLERIQFIPYEAHLKVLILSAYGDDQLRIESYSSELNSFECVNIVEAADDKVTFDLGADPMQPAHFLVASILNKKPIDNVYAPASVTRYNDLRKLARVITASAASILLLGIALNVPGLMGVFDKWSQAETFSTRTAPLRREYETLSQRFPDTPIPPREMALVVGTASTINQQSRSPVVDLGLIADALAMSPGLEIRNIQWSLEQQSGDTDENGNRAGVDLAREFRDLSGDNLITGLMLQGQTQVNLTIEGQAYSANSFRDTQNQVLAFRNALASNPEVTIAAARLPVDLNAETRVSTTLNDSDVRANFMLQLVIDFNDDNDEDDNLLAEALRP